MVKARNLAVVVLVVVAVGGLAVGDTAPRWDMAHLVGLIAFALVTMDVLSRGRSR